MIQLLSNMEAIKEKITKLKAQGGKEKEKERSSHRFNDQSKNRTLLENALLEIWLHNTLESNMSK